MAISTKWDGADYSLLYTIGWRAQKKAVALPPLELLIIDLLRIDTLIINDGCYLLTRVPAGGVNLNVEDDTPTFFWKFEKNKIVV